MNNQLVQKLSFQEQEPITALAWKNDCQLLYVGLGGGQIKSYDMNGNQQNIFKHENAVTGLHVVDNAMLMSTSLDQTVKFFQGQNVCLSVQFSHKILASEHTQGLTALSLSESKIAIFDLQTVSRFNNQLWQNYIDSPLNQQNQSIALNKCLDNSYVLVIGSVDGRANISNVLKDAQNNQFYRLNHIMTFKCHKTEDHQKHSEMYPVSGTQTNPKQDKWVCTSGGEGKMIFWDLMQKNKIKDFTFASQPVTKIRVSPDGAFVAYALGYDWSEGVWGLEKNIKPKICVHPIQPNELRYQN